MNTKTPAFCSILLIVLSLLVANGQAGSQSLDEYELKSGILYRICKYTRWPNAPGPDKPFIISILGDSTPNKEINIPSNETIDKRKIVLRKINQLPEINGSDVLFITGSEAYRVREILAYTSEKPILTVGDTDGFGEEGVIINFYIQKKKVGFEINYEASKKASLKMHSQLFAIGRVVKTKKSLAEEGLE